MVNVVGLLIITFIPSGKKIVLLCHRKTNMLHKKSWRNELKRDTLLDYQAAISFLGGEFNSLWLQCALLLTVPSPLTPLIRMICNVHAALATVRRFYRVFTPAESETRDQMDGNGEIN